MIVSVVPQVRFSGWITNYGSDGSQGDVEMKFVDFLNDPINITIPDGLTTAGIKRHIRNKLREIIQETIQKNIYKDVGTLTGEEGSPPQLIVLPGNYWLEEEVQEEFYREHITASFRVLTTSNPSLHQRFFGQEKVWDNRATIYNASSVNTYYKGGDKRLTCAYDYLVNEYAEQYGVKKFTTEYNVSGKRGEKVKGKDIIDYWVSLPVIEQQEIYNEWCRRNQDSFLIRDIVKKKIHPLPEEIGLQGLGDELWTIKFTNIDTTYNDEDNKTTLSILDIVKWCICADVHLSVRDYDNKPYLSYNPKEYKHEYKKKYDRKGIVLKVEHKHAYFETDGKKIHSEMLKNNKQTLDFEELRTTKVEDKKDDLPVIYHFDETAKQSTPPPTMCPNAEGSMTKYDWSGWRDYFVEMLLEQGREVKVEKTLDSGKVIIKRIRRDFKNYTEEQMKEFMDDDKNQHVLYKDISNLNKLAVSMLEKHQLKHDTSSGGLHTIRQLKYGNLTIMSRCGKTCKEDLVDEEEWTKEWDKVYKKHPELRKNTGLVPSPKQVADYLWSKMNNDPMLSCMNGQLRSIFYNCEITPENLDLQPAFFDRPIISFDIKKAYTTALEVNEFRYNVYDSVSQPRKFSGTLNPNYFYLAKGLSTDYPVKKGKGLMLYHGCLARHLHPKKICIKYEIQPKKQLTPEFFKEFVEKVKDAKEFNEVVSPKSIINQFIGGLKRKDNLDNYTHYITDDMITVNRAIDKGNQPTQMDESEYWIIASAWRNTHYQNGQPIRLQVIDMINEQMYLFNKWAGKVYKNPTLSIRTDAVYLQTKYEEIDCCSAEAIQDRLEMFNESNDYQFEVEKTLTKESYEMMRYNADDVKIKLGYVFMPNKWETNIVIDKKWSKVNGANHILNIIIATGGALVEGMAGRGKSELLLALATKCRKNRVKYYLYKECLRLIKARDRHKKLEAYRDKHPCFVRMFAPTNKSANRVNGKTLHKGWGIPVIDTDEIDDEETDEVSESTEATLKESFTDKIIESYAGDGHKKDALDFAVIDEISMCNGDMISYISYFKQKLPHVKIILCGDIEHQLPPVKEEHRNFQHSYALKEITNFTRIQLNYNFRMDKATDNLWDNWSINPQRFTPKCDTKTQRNLCRYNATRKKVINELQDLIPNPVVLESKKINDPRGHTRFTKYGLGTPMIARKSNADIGLAKNEMYYVMCIEPLKLSNLDADKPQVLEIEKDELLKYFQSGLCITIHKSQGETYDDIYTIHDWRIMAIDKTQMGRRLRYTAQSRSSNPENNILYRE